MLTLRDAKNAVIYTLDYAMMPALNAVCKSEFRIDNYLGNGNNDTVAFVNMQNNLVYAPCLLKYKS